MKECQIMMSADCFYNLLVSVLASTRGDPGRSEAEL